MNGIIEHLDKLKTRLAQLDNERIEVIKQIRQIETNLTQSIIDKHSYSSTQKITMFMQLFGNRIDVFPKAWASKAGKSGWSPACANEWKQGLCNKKTIKCNVCPNKTYIPFDEKIALEHFKGIIFAGMFAIDADGMSKFLAADFDEEDWLADAVLYRKTAEELGITVGIERSRSGKGCHCWIFFEQKITAREARKLGFIVLDLATNASTLGKFKSYDRLFPNQDEIRDGGFGNLIALPFYGKGRDISNTVFINDDASVKEDQWGFIFSLPRLSKEKLTEILAKYERELTVPLEDDIISIVEISAPKNSKGISRKFDGIVKAVLSTKLTIETQDLPGWLLNALKRLVTFSNPEFFKNEHLRKSNWDTPRHIVRGEMEGSRMILSRGVREAAASLVTQAGGQWAILDKRPDSQKLETRILFKAKLRADQQEAFQILLEKQSGVLVAPTGTGKTVIACALIAELSIPTLVICHRSQIAEQWAERMLEFTTLTKKQIGFVLGSKKTQHFIVDIALFQSLINKDDIQAFLANYSLVIVDESHHIPALSFEALLSNVTAKRIIGLTATPKRADGFHPIMEMQCGPILHVIKEPIRSQQIERHLIIREIDSGLDSVPAGSDIHVIWEKLLASEMRIKLIAEDVLKLIKTGRRILVLSERKELLNKIIAVVEMIETNLPLFLITGELGVKARRKIFANLEIAFQSSSGCALFATGSLVGEGVDIPKLDSLILAFPCSSKAKLTQYIGRIERENENKSTTIIIDYFDKHPVTLSMAKKRSAIYRTLKYKKMDTLDFAVVTQKLELDQYLF